MEQITMEKKNQQRPVALSNKSNFDLKSSDNFSKKNGGQFPRKREYEKLDKKSTPNRNGRPSQRNVRPREKMGSQVENCQDDSEFGSIQRSGGKKQDLNRCFQKWWDDSSKHPARGYQTGTKHFGKRHSLYHANYSKEHYMQANCQFVVIAGNDYSIYEKNADNLVDWNLIEEVRLHMTESPSCPICLHPPVVARITRCGHIYCFSCVLHYLALSDKKWRKCPICDQIISKEDLKSVKSIVHKTWRCGDKIELKLMRRDRDSLIPVSVVDYCSSSKWKELPSLSDPESAYSYTKLIVASAQEVVEHIISSELRDLQFKLATEGEEPEACFIEAALSLVSDRHCKILKSSIVSSSDELAPLVELKCQGNSGVVSGSSTLSSADSSSVENDKDLYSPDDMLNFGAMSLTKRGITTRESFSSEEESISVDHSSAVKFASAAETSRAVIGPKSTYYFYQESGGSHIYLNSLNIRMLTKEYGSLENCPPTLKAEVLEKESESMTDSLRQRMRCLSHLPISCAFEVVEIDLGFPVISLLTKAEFEGQLEQRERNRRRRVREEKRIERRVKVEEDRIMGRIHKSYNQSTSFEHFPNFAVEEGPVPNSEEETVPSVQETCSASASPPQEVFSNSGSISFAQMIREGPKQPNKSFSRSLAKPPKKGNDTWPSVCVTDSDDEAEAVPDFSESFSADFDMAFAAQKSNSSDVSLNQKGKKGKKKKKRIVIMSY